MTNIAAGMESGHRNAAATMASTIPAAIESRARAFTVDEA
jgi:hypothetical protein